MRRPRMAPRRSERGTRGRCERPGTEIGAVRDRRGMIETGAGRSRIFLRISVHEFLESFALFASQGSCQIALAQRPLRKFVAFLVRENEIFFSPSSFLSSLVIFSFFFHDSSFVVPLSGEISAFPCLEMLGCRAHWVSLRLQVGSWRRTQKSSKLESSRAQ